MVDFETPRLNFRRFTPDDLHALAAIRADAEVMKYIAAGTPESIEEVRVVLDKVIAQWDQHGFGCLGVDG
jgi:RimJ/RimL family protein N-acetyltransferase